MNSIRVVPTASPVARPVTALMSHPDYPIERRIRSNAHDFQLAFAEEATARLKDSYDDALLVASRDGLLVLARNEQALKAPTDAVRALYPWQLAVGTAQVRYRDGPQDGVGGPRVDATIREPVMQVTVDVPRRCAQAILDDITGRTERQVTLTYACDRAVITARVALARLLGYADTLDNLTRGESTVRISLSGYEPVVPPDGPVAA